MITISKSTVLRYYLINELLKIMSIAGSIESHEVMAITEGTITVSLNMHDSQQCIKYLS